MFTSMVISMSVVECLYIYFGGVCPEGLEKGSNCLTFAASQDKRLSKLNILFGLEFFFQI